VIRDVESQIADILRREGGFVDHPADRGGPTNRGVTRAALARYRGHAVTVDDVRNLTEAEARNIYRNDYFTSPQLHRIHDPYVACLAFDCSVNHGPHRVIRWLQQIVGVIDDGILGDTTEVAVNGYEPVRLYNRLLAKRIVFYGEIISRDHSQAVFALGWLRRAAEFLETP
jgi:lysozyme family protein